MPPNENSAPAPTLVLASGSPRRSEILSEAGVPFEIDVSGIDEKSRAGEAPADLAGRLASEKCLDVARRRDDPESRPVLGADTIVVAPGDEVLGKPRDEAHAQILLAKLVGRTHQVMTGVAVSWSGADATVRTTVVCSDVTMRAATAAEIAEYVAVGESLDKAGGYALQGEGARFVERVEGSRSNVIGLPLEETLALLRAAGVTAESLGE